MNGTIHRSGRYLGEMDEPDKEKPGYASDADVANAFRAVACVNALEGIRHPAAVAEALAALEAADERLRILGRQTKGEEGDLLRELASRTTQALRALTVELEI